MQMNYIYTYENYKFSAKKAYGKKIILDKKIVRFMLLLFIMTISLTFGAMMHAYANNNEIQPIPVQEQVTIDVQQGDTLWSIAKAYAPEDMDIRSYIHKVKKINKLQSSSIQEGQILILP